MIEWPEDKAKPVSFSDLADPIVKAIKFAYTMRRKNKGQDIPYKGYDIGRRDRAACLSPDESLSAESLEWQEDDQGRTPLEILVALAVQLGIEQGRRLGREDTQMELNIVKMYLDRLNETFTEYFPEAGLDKH